LRFRDIRDQVFKKGLYGFKGPSGSPAIYGSPKGSTDQRLRATPNHFGHWLLLLRFQLLETAAAIW